KSCSEFGSYVRQVLGPYAVNVTTAARLCGVSLCQGRGRCVRKKPEDPTYLHLPSAHFMLLPNGAEGVRATGQLPTAYIDLWRKDFRCQCSGSRIRRGAGKPRENNITNSKNSVWDKPDGSSAYKAASGWRKLCTLYTHHSSLLSGSSLCLTSRELECE
ncbi:hypothetical protein M9458_017561, partial [Cirrhinus mrigala]